MAYRGMGETIQSSQQKVKKAAEDLAAQRRIYEAEVVQKKAVASSEELQGTVMRWLPRVAVGVGAVVVGFLVWKRMRRK